MVGLYKVYWVGNIQETKMLAAIINTQVTASVQEAADDNRF